MSITTELRKYASSLAMRVGASTYEVKVALEEIADHIDQEHDGEVFDLLREHDEWVHDRDANYIQLPKDADGETIHLQDRMSWDNGTFDVHELNLNADGWTTWDIPHGYTVRADQCHHVQPDSWERIIEDAQADGVRWHNDGRPSDFDALVERCKRLAGEDA